MSFIKIAVVFSLAFATVGCCPKCQSGVDALWKHAVRFFYFLPKIGSHIRVSLKNLKHHQLNLKPQHLFLKLAIVFYTKNLNARPF